jgi:hypothetical protein
MKILHSDLEDILQRWEIEFYFKGCTAFSATVERCQGLQLTHLAQLYWAGHLMVYWEVFIYECLSFMSAQDFGSDVDLLSDPGFVSCNPGLEMVNLGDLGQMLFWAGLEICCTAVVETQILEFVQCLNLVLCCGKAYLLLGCGILPMSGFISGVPFLLTFLPYQTGEIAGPSYSVIHVGWFKGLGRNILLLKLLPFGRPSTKDELIPPNAVLALNKGGEASWN